MRELKFKTHAHLKNVLGQELINDDNVAVQELVKNSYDAGSKKVEIIFNNLKVNEDSKLNKSTREKYISKSSKLLIIDEAKEKDLTDKNIAKEQLKHDKKMDKYVNDYNKVSGKNIDKTKVKINKELVVDNILFTYVNIDGRDYTVLSNLQNE